MIRFRPPFTDDWSAAHFSGESAEAAMSILIARLLSADFEVEYFDDDEEEWVAYGAGDDN